MDLERQRSCNNEFDDNCTKWKSIERMVVGVIVTIITVSVPIVPILNLSNISDFTDRIKAVYNYVSKTKNADGDMHQTILFGATKGKTKWSGISAIADLVIAKN